MVTEIIPWKKRYVLDYFDTKKSDYAKERENVGDWTLKTLMGKNFVYVPYTLPTSWVCLARQCDLKAYPLVSNPNRLI